MVFGAPTVVINTYLRLADYAAIGLAFIGSVHWGLAMAAGAPGLDLPPTRPPRGDRPELGRHSRYAPRTPQAESEARRMAPRSPPGYQAD